jgi:hypothetical protein
VNYVSSLIKEDVMGRFALLLLLAGPVVMAGDVWVTTVTWVKNNGDKVTLSTSHKSRAHANAVAKAESAKGTVVDAKTGSFTTNPIVKTMSETEAKQAAATVCKKGECKP